MKDLRLVLPIILLILLVFLFTGCSGVVPSPGATEDDDTAVIGQILMPFCCLTEDQMQDTESSVSRYSGYECEDETQLWRPASEALVELRAFDNCKVKYTATTDETGYYEFTDVKPGMYILTTYCPTDEDFFVKDVIEKSAGEALYAGIPDCDSTSLALVIEYIGDTYCHCLWICPCFNEEWSDEYKLIEEIATSGSVNMQVNIPEIIGHSSFGDLCESNDDLVDLVCSKLNSCCFSPGQTEENGDDDPCEGNNPPVINSVLLNGSSVLSGSTQNIEVDTEYILTINASDDNVLPKPANPLTYSVNITKDADPPIDINLGTANSYTGTPVSADVGEYAVVLSVNDGCDSTDFGFTAVVNPQPDPKIKVIKNATAINGQQPDPFEYIEVEDTISYTITVENTGNVPVTNLSVTDPKATTGPNYYSGDANTNNILDVGEIWTYLATHTITDDDLNAGSFTNTATATGKDPQNQDVTDSDDETVDAAICYTLILNVNPSGGGNVSGAGIFADGTVAPISATANAGYQFTGWTVDLGDSNNVGNTGSSSTNVEMNEDMTLTANFTADIFEGGVLSIAFEDLEIAESSDYDYNDWVVDLEMNTFYDGDTPNLSSITFDITPKARGAGNDHRFHIKIPADTFDEDGDFVLEIFNAGGDDSGTFNSNSDMDFVLIPDTRDSLGDENHNHTNTKEGEGPTVATVWAKLTITFDTPFYHDFSQYDPYSASNMHGEGLFFDPYIEVDEAEADRTFDNPDYEVHQGDPRILTVPDSWEWPEEGVAIWAVYVDSVSMGNPPVFTPAWWEDSHNNCVYGDGITCP